MADKFHTILLSRGESIQKRSQIRSLQEGELFLEIIKSVPPFGLPSIKLYSAIDDGGEPHSLIDLYNEEYRVTQQALNAGQDTKINDNFTNIESHKNNQNNPHGATWNPTSEKIVKWDEDGNLRTNFPLLANHSATKGYVDDEISKLDATLRELLKAVYDDPDGDLTDSLNSILELANAINSSGADISSIFDALNLKANQSDFDELRHHFSTLKDDYDIFRNDYSILIDQAKIDQIKSEVMHDINLNLLSLLEAANMHNATNRDLFSLFKVDSASPLSLKDLSRKLHDHIQSVHAYRYMGLRIGDYFTIPSSYPVIGGKKVAIAGFDLLKNKGVAGESDQSNLFPHIVFTFTEAISSGIIHGQELVLRHTNPNWVEEATIPNPDYYPPTIPNPNYKPEFIVNPDYQPPTISNPDYDPEEPDLFPEFIPNPDYDLDLYPEAIPNPEYDPEQTPTLPNPDHDPEQPETLPNPDYNPDLPVDLISEEWAQPNNLTTFDKTVDLNGEVIETSIFAYLQSLTNILTNDNNGFIYIAQVNRRVSQHKEGFGVGNVPQPENYKLPSSHVVKCYMFLPSEVEINTYPTESQNCDDIGNRIVWPYFYNEDGPVLLNRQMKLGAASIKWWTETPVFYTPTFVAVGLTGEMEVVAKDVALGIVPSFAAY